MKIKIGQGQTAFDEIEVSKENFFDNAFSLSDVTLLSISSNEIDEHGHFEIPDGVTSIGDYALYKCLSLVSLTIPSSVNSIGYRAFYRCKNLANLNIPDSVTSIGDEAFSLCKLTNFSLPTNLINIGKRVFAASKLTQLPLPDSLMCIGESSFEQCFQLTHLTIPKGVASIGYRAFAFCEKLTNLVLPENITTISERAFYLCSGLLTITLPASVTRIGQEALFDCYGLNSIIIDGEDSDLERIRDLLPEEFQDKVIKKSTYDKAILPRTDAIMQLAKMYQVSPIFKWSDYLNPVLPEDILSEINTYLLNDAALGPIFKAATKKIESLPAPRTTDQKISYKVVLSEIVNTYANIVKKKIKPSIKHQFFVANNEKALVQQLKLNLKYKAVPKIIKGVKRLSSMNGLRSCVPCLPSVSSGNLIANSRVEQEVLVTETYAQTGLFFSTEEQRSGLEEKNEVTEKNIFMDMGA